MHTSAHRSPRSAAEAVLSLAKKLHRAAASESLALSLPVLRRLLATCTLRDLSLPQLRRQRSMVQRKHILRLLATEAGFPNWEAYRQALECMAPEQLPHFDAIRVQAGYPNLWFSSHAEALSHAQVHGGRVMAVGHQAVLLPEVECNPQLRQIG